MNERKIKTWPFTWRMIRYAPWPYGVYVVTQIVFMVGRVIPGLIEKAIFDGLSGERAAVSSVWTLLALYVGAEGARLVTSFGTIWGEVTFRRSAGALLQHNLFAALLRRPGALTLPVPSGEAVNRYRDDVGEVSDFPLWVPSVAGEVLLFVVAVAIMASINLTITLVIFVPLVLVVGVTRLAWSRMLAYRHASRRATGHVTGFLGEMFGAVQAIKVANAERNVVAHLDDLNEQRRRMAVRDRLFSDVIDSVSGTAVSFGIGVTLLLAGSAISAGTFSVGDFALFVYYLWFTANLPSTIGTFIGDYRQQEVALDRLVELIPDESPQVLAQHQPLHRTQNAEVAAERSADEPLQTLHVRGLRYQHPGTSVGINNLDLHLDRGTLTVITGRVGAGKTTALRTLLGLLPRDAGEIRWNDQPIADAAAWFRPPRAAYTPQVPRLFSDTLRENIGLGAAADDSDLTLAIEHSVLEHDLATLERGLDTVVGPRGVRLSGGQVQRAAAARMFVRQPDLLVFDDLSSALDVETERVLWQRLLQHRGKPDAPTILAVSHRRAALRHADQIIVLHNGSIESVGTLDELLMRSPELRRLWEDEGRGK